MNIIDNTKGKKPNNNEEFVLTIEHQNGDRHVYYGNTRKGANKNFKDKYPYYTKSIISKIWEIESK